MLILTALTCVSLLRNPHRSADIWSVGCVVFEMATGKPPWNHFSQEVSAIFHIASAREPPKPPVWLSVQAQDFAKQCLRLCVDTAISPLTLAMLPNRAVACSGLPRHAGCRRSGPRSRIYRRTRS